MQLVVSCLFYSSPEFSVTYNKKWVKKKIQISAVRTGVRTNMDAPSLDLTLKMSR